MRVLSLFLPRLGIQLARTARPELAGRPLGLLAGEGDRAILAAVSVEATAAGAEPGMTALQARQRCPALVLERDNARESLERLEALAAILRSRATPNVAIVSRNSLAISLEGLDSRFPSEDSAAQAILTLARSWSGLDVRAAVASTVAEAETAARTARRHPVILHGASPEPVALPSREPISVRFAWESPAAASTVAARLVRMLGSLQPVVEASGQSFRLVSVELERGPYRTAFVARPAQPIHRATEALDLLRERLDSAMLEGVTAIRVTLGQPGPSVEVEPWRAPVATFHHLSAPAIPVQRRLLRAS